MRYLKLVMFGMCGVLATTSDARAQARPARSDSAQFASDWQIVKQRYPRVALAYLRREALNYQLVATILGADDSDSGPRRVSQPVRADVICILFRRMGVLPLPAQCDPIILPPTGSIEDCFRPKPQSDGTYKEPTTDEAEACVRDAIRPRR